MPPKPKRSLDAERVGSIIRRLRTERGWSIAKLARRCGLNATYLGVVERGGNMPSVEVLLEIGEVLQISAGDIVREVEELRRDARKPRAASPSPRRDPRQNHDREEHDP